MQVDKNTWSIVPFTECVHSIKVKDAVQKKDYKATGLYPIVSQEKEFISGFCDSKEYLNTDLGNIIVFGDHTRILKFIDFDFCIGADGVKVLSPFGDLDAKFLYYYLLWADIPSNGYSRHFKFLKKLDVPHPPIDDQYDIASELDALQEIIDGYKAQIADLDALAQSIFLETFGDPIANPKGWEVMKLTEVCSKITDGTHLSPKWVDRGIPFIFVANVKDYSISFNVQKYIDETTYRDLWKSTPIEKGDILYTSVGSYGNPAIVRDDRKFMFQRHIALIKPLHSIINNQYLMYFLTSPSGKKQADDKVIGSAQKTLNLKVIKNFDVLLPPIELQQQFASQVEAIEQQKELLRQQLADAEMLMAERMQYYFS